MIYLQIRICIIIFVRIIPITKTRLKLYKSILYVTSKFSCWNQKRFATSTIHVYHPKLWFIVFEQKHISILRGLESYLPGILPSLKFPRQASAKFSREVWLWKSQQSCLKNSNSLLLGHPIINLVESCSDLLSKIVIFAPFHVCRRVTAVCHWMDVIKMPLSKPTDPSFGTFWPLFGLAFLDKHRRFAGGETSKWMQMVMLWIYPPTYPWWWLAVWVGNNRSTHFGMLYVFPMVKPFQVLQAININPAPRRSAQGVVSAPALWLNP